MIIFAVFGGGVGGAVRKMKVKNKLSKKEKEHPSWKTLTDKLAFVLTAGFITN